MNRPNPAIVSQAGARPLPRWALLLVCAAYLLPGQFGRDAWRHADLAAFGFMSALAQGQTSWWSPLLGGLPTTDGALLPYWLGALSIRALPFLEPALAARLPFIVVLGLVLALIWYAAFHLARTEAAQPVSFAFGGEADTRDYARALADAAVLALMASLGLLMLGHETTPELLQLLGVSLWMYALACAPYRPLRSQYLVGLSLILLALSGAPQFALLLGAGGLLVCHYSRFESARQLRLGLLLGMTATVALAFLFDLWRWRLDWPDGLSLLRQLLWFTWPSAPLAAWTLWRWRGHFGSRHLAVPLTLAIAALITCIGLAGSDRALLLALPALAVLASFALPTLNRGLSAMVDWFSVFFFSALTLFVWFYFLALHTSWFPRASASASRALSGESAGPLDAIALALGLAGTLSWLLLVRWRTSRQRSALWRSLVLPAGGTVTLWLLAMTLFLAPLDLARSNRVLLANLRSVLPAAGECIALPERSLSLAATLQAQGGWTVRADLSLDRSPCNWALRTVPARITVEIPTGWQLQASLLRPTERSTRYQVLVRSQPR
jgi:hypothetical protein